MRNKGESKTVRQKEYSFRINLGVILVGTLVQTGIRGAQIGAINEKIKQMEKAQIESSRIAIVETKLNIIDEDNGAPRPYRRGSLSATLR